jgi:hypothetical protein
LSVKWDSVEWVVGEIFVGEMYPNRKIRSLLGKKRIANFNHFLKKPLCEVS